MEPQAPQVVPQQLNREQADVIVRTEKVGFRVRMGSDFDDLSCVVKGRSGAVEMNCQLRIRDVPTEAIDPVRREAARLELVSKAYRLHLKLNHPK